MKLAILRIHGVHCLPEEVVRHFEEEPDSVWRAGERGLRGKTRADSGVAYCVSDASSNEELLRDIRAFVRRNESGLSELANQGLHAELDVGVSVGDSSQYTSSILFEAEDLRVFSNLGIRLVFSAYPTSDEMNVNDATL